MTKKQKPLRELKRDTRRVVNDALASLRDLREEIDKNERVPLYLRNSVWNAFESLENAKRHGVPWWKNS